MYHAQSLFAGFLKKFLKHRGAYMQMPLGQNQGAPQQHNRQLDFPVVLSLAERGVQRAAASHTITGQ